MPVQFISHHYSNKLGNPGDKQVSMKRFFILRFTPGNTETVLEMVDWFLNIYPDLIGGIPFGRITERTRIGAQVFLGININILPQGDSVQGFSQWQTRLLLQLFYHIPISFSGIQTSWLAVPYALTLQKSKKLLSGMFSFFNKSYLHQFQNVKALSLYIR